MPRIRYDNITFSDARMEIVKRAIALVADYRRQGYSLTLRQLYYQFVSRDWFPSSWADASTGSTNNERSYKKLGDIISDGRMAGLIDWTAIEDRTRNVDGNSHWDSPKDIVEICARQFALDKWEDQKNRAEVWVEKDALEGVVGKVARECDVQFFSCRGYASMTSIWDAGQRLKSYAQKGQTPIILHLGDHDPSGIDMSRDIDERVRMFMDDQGHKLKFVRIALNMPQIREFAPPPNPAKVTDSRYKKYQEEHGDESWELDALDPAVIDALVKSMVLKYRDEKKFSARLAEEDAHKLDLQKAASHWDGEVKDVLETLDA
jgi:hypothetical protein